MTGNGIVCVPSARFCVFAHEAQNQIVALLFILRFNAVERTPQTEYGERQTILRRLVVFL